MGMMVPGAIEVGSKAGSAVWRAINGNACGSRVGCQERVVGWRRFSDIFWRIVLPSLKIFTDRFDLFENVSKSTCWDRFGFLTFFAQIDFQTFGS